MGSHLETLPLIINGKPTTASSPQQFSVYSLEQEKDVYLAESADVNAANRAADAAWTAFQAWKKTHGVERRNLLLRYAQILRNHETELVDAQRAETGMSEMWAKKNVELSVGLIEEIAACITRLHGEIPQTQTPGGLALALTVPIGPVLAIAPWNSPVILAGRAIATPVAAGCTVVLKASELSPKTHHLLVKYFEEAGLPKGVVNILQTRREDAAVVTEALIAHSAIRKVEFIGSAGIGKIIGQLAGKYLKPVLMELGGKGPVIVLEDANLAQAAQKSIAGAFLHHGQLCFSTERVIVLKSVANEFQEILKRTAASFAPGNAVTARMMDQSLQKLEDAKSKGASFLVGGPGKLSQSGLKPTILTGVTSAMDISDEEAFGPSFSLYIADNDQEAIRMANATKYGLNAVIHSTRMEHALAVALELETGQVHVNSMTAHDEPTLPVGGSKGSGWGRNNALWGLREFTEVKTITLSMGGNSFI